MKKVNTKFKRIIKKVFNIMRKPIMSILPGQMSFFLLLSLIPTLLIVGVVTTSFSISIDGIVDFIKNNFPANTSKLIIPLLSGKGFDYNLIILVFSALLLVSKGTRAIITAANTIYKVENDGIKDTIKSFITAIILVLLILFIIVIPVFGVWILRIIFSFAHNSDAAEDIIYIFNVLKWPISIFIIFFNVKLIYTISPNKQIKSASVTKGALFTTFLWTVSTFIYSFYITHLSKYNIFYGGASNIIILMLWIYLISYIFVLGMSINASTDV